MDQRAFVSVFVGVGLALSLLLVSLGLVQVLDVQGPWSMVLAGGLLAVLVSVGSLIVREASTPLVKR